MDDVGVCCHSNIQELTGNSTTLPKHYENYDQYTVINYDQYTVINYDQYTVINVFQIITHLMYGCVRM